MLRNPHCLGEKKRKPYEQIKITTT